MQPWRALLSGIRELAWEVSADDVGTVAGSLAYQFLLALFPFTIFLTALGALVSQFFGIADPSGQIMAHAGAALPADAWSAIETQLAAVLRSRQPGLLSFGIIGAIWAASGGMSATMHAMNRAYEIPEQRSFLRRTALAAGLTVFVGVALPAAFVLAVAGGAIANAITDAVGAGEVYRAALGVVRLVGMIALASATVAVLFRIAPAVCLPWRWVLPGTVLFVVAWLAASIGFALYVSHFGSYDATYGTIGGVVVLMVWFYITAYVLLVGAELNALLARHADAHVLPDHAHAPRAVTSRA